MTRPLPPEGAPGATESCRDAAEADPSRTDAAPERVAVVIPAYNAAATVDRTILSARAQTYADLEIIVVDDGSTDRTAEIVRRHAAADGRVILVQQENQGLAAARNRGVSEATAALVAPLDADDVWHPRKIELQVATLRQRGPGCAMVYTFSSLIDGEDRVISPPLPVWQAPEGEILRALLLSNFIGNGSAVLMRTEAFWSCGGYDPGLRAAGAQGCEDLKLYLAIAERHDVGVVPLELTGYRITPTSMSADIRRMIRSHWLTVSPYIVRYPHLADEVRRGHIALALWYIVRATRRFQLRRALPELSALPWGTAPRLAARIALETMAAEIRSELRATRRRSAAPFRFEVGELP